MAIINPEPPLPRPDEPIPINPEPPEVPVDEPRDPDGPGVIPPIPIPPVQAELIRSQLAHNGARSDGETGSALLQ